MINKMYKLFYDNIPDYEGKICIPISGGLDSRVIAGLISRKRKIDLAYCQYELPYPIKIDKGINHVKYARQIAEVCGVERFVTINVNHYTQEDIDAVEGLPMEDMLLKSKMYTGLRKLNDQVDMVTGWVEGNKITKNEYTFILGHGLDSLTGVHVNPLTLFNYDLHDIETMQKYLKYFDRVFDRTYGQFGKWSCPLWNQEIEDFCLSLPLRYRFHQYLYRQMIKTFFPDLAAIPREGMDVRMDIGEIRYFIERSKYWLRK